MRLFLFAVSLTLFIGSVGCSGPRAFTKGAYDDPERVALLDDRFNEADMQQLADAVIQAMVACNYVRNAAQAPVVIVERVQNRTQEHIDLKGMTDMIRTNLIRSGKVRFVDKEQREALEREYEYQESGAVSGPTMAQRGRQIGADYLLGGAIMSNVQEVGRDKLIYYKLTMNLTNLETSLIDCVEEKQIRKQYRKQNIRL
jgi:penicillin-binding protein activator